MVPLPPQIEHVLAREKEVAQEALARGDKVGPPTPTPLSRCCWLTTPCFSLGYCRLGR